MKQFFSSSSNIPANIQPIANQSPLFTVISIRSAQIVSTNCLILSLLLIVKQRERRNRLFISALTPNIKNYEYRCFNTGEKQGGRND